MRYYGLNLQEEQEINNRIQRDCGPCFSLSNTSSSGRAAFALAVAIAKDTIATSYNSGHDSTACRAYLLPNEETAKAPFEDWKKAGRFDELHGDEQARIQRLFVIAWRYVGGDFDDTRIGIYAEKDRVFVAQWRESVAQYLRDYAVFSCFRS